MPRKQVSELAQEQELALVVVVQVEGAEEAVRVAQGSAPEQESVVVVVVVLAQELVLVC